MFFFLCVSYFLVTEGMFLSNNCVSKWKLIIGKDQLYVRQHYDSFQLEVICKFCYFIQLRVLISSVPFCYGFPFYEVIHSYGWLSCHGRKHSQTIFTIEIPIKILAPSTCMIDFLCENMVARSLCNDRKSALSHLFCNRRNHS